MKNLKKRGSVRFSMYKKFSLMLGVLAFIFIGFSLFCFVVDTKSVRTAIELYSKILPCEKDMSELKNIISQSADLTKSHLLDVWVGSENKRDYYTSLTKVKYPQIISRLDSYSVDWDSTTIALYEEIKFDVEKSLFIEVSRLLRKLDDMEVEATDEEKASFIEAVIYPTVASDGKLINHVNLIHKNIDKLTQRVSDKRQLIEQDFIYCYDRNVRTFIWLVIIFFIAWLFVLINIFIRVVKPIVLAKDEIEKMSLGILDFEKQKPRNDEIGDLFEALENMDDGLQRTSDFAKEIGKGNYSMVYKPLSSKDELGNALIELRNDLEKANNEANERKEQDQIQNWTTRGLANFADILRMNSNDISLFGRKIINNLVNYLKINQGGIFIYNDEDPNNCYLDLIAMYAYSRDKYANRKVIPGEGLVGTCFLEQQTIYMTEVPDSYIEITSGLGDANPNSILIVPLKIEGSVLGVIELASFNEFKPHEIAFIEKVCDSIASTLHNVRINNSTAQLLEKSKKQAEEMKIKDEEMQQNFEELQATQDEAAYNQQQLEHNLMVAQKEIERLRERLAEYDKGL